MKILFIIQRPQLRGAEIFACQLAMELVNKDVHVDVIHLFSDGDGLREQFPRLNFLNLKAHQSRRLTDFIAFKNLADLINHENYDLIQANAGDTLKYAVLSRYIFKWKAKLIFRNANKMSAFIHNTFQRKLNQWLLSNCNYFISVSEICRQDLISLYADANHKSTTIPIGTYSFDHVKSFDRIPISNNPVFINIGSFVPEKNHNFLLDMFATYYKRRGSGVLWLVGDGKLRSKLEEKAQKLGLNDKVVFWGVRQDAIALLKSADVMVMPSLIEGLPGVVLESLACGIPVLASDAGGISEVIDNASNGYALPVMEIDKYVSALEVLTTDTKVRNKFITAGKQLVKNKYLMPHIGDLFHQVYKNIL